MDIRDLFNKKREAHARFVEIQNDLGDAAPNAEQQQELDRLEEVLVETTEQIQTFNAAEERRAKANVWANELDAAKAYEPGNLQPVESTPAPMSRTERFRAWADEGLGYKEIVAEMAKADNKDQRKSFSQFLKGMIPATQAALQMDGDAEGGYLVAPEQFIARLIQDLDNRVFMRQICTVIPVTGAESIGAPSLDTDFGDVEWTTELSTGSADTSLVFGKRRLTPHPLARRILVSKDLLASAAISVEAIVRERFAYKFGLVEDNGFLQGTGDGEPLGVFTASDDGVATGQDVSTDNTDTAFTADGLINCKYNLGESYLQNANLNWVMHKDAVKMARKLKTGDGQYILTPGLTGDGVDRILDVPVQMSSQAPSTFTSGLYVGIIGDFSQYWIADSMSVSVQRLLELYAATNQDGFIGRRKSDGMPVLSTAFSRVKLA